MLFPFLESIALCTNFQVINLVIMYLLILLSATASSFEFPARLAVIPHLVPRHQMADMVSVILQGIVVQSTTPDELRGRISAFTSMFAIGGPMLGSFESGLVAGLFTPTIAVVSGGVVCILVARLVLGLVPGLAKVKIQAEGIRGGQEIAFRRPDKSGEMQPSASAVVVFNDCPVALSVLDLCA